MNVTLTRKQADTLLAAQLSLGRCCDTTSEISASDNSAPGTGQRLSALVRKGLLTQTKQYGGRIGAGWELTARGRNVAQAVHLADSAARGEQRRRTGSALGVFDLSGTYEA